VKKKNFKIMSMLLLISCMLTLNVYAATRASDQIAAYDGDAIACGSGRLAIEFSIDGTDQMKKLGASKIRISEDDGRGGWITAEVFTSSDAGMTASGRNFYGTTKYFNGVSGTYYKVEITVFATDYDGVTDSRTVTCYVTA